MAPAPDYSPRVHTDVRDNADQAPLDTLSPLPSEQIASDTDWLDTLMVKPSDTRVLDDLISQHTVVDNTRYEYGYYVGDQLIRADCVESEDLPEPTDHTSAPPNVTDDGFRQPETSCIYFIFPRQVSGLSEDLVIVKIFFV